jgi:hypothetical protein
MSELTIEQVKIDLAEFEEACNALDFQGGVRLRTIQELVARAQRSFTPDLARLAISQAAEIERLRGLVDEDDRTAYDPNYGDERPCQCGHDYYRHFDSWDDMRPVGCKYCECRQFTPQAPADE